MNGLVFGSTGFLGSAIYERCRYLGWNTSRGTREFQNDLNSQSQYDFIIWANGANTIDRIDDFSDETHLRLYDANVLFIASSLRFLIKNNLLASNSKLCVISSIWQHSSKRNKFSYSVTKSALSGFVKSACVDLGSHGILINTCDPGVVNSPMTRRNMSASQLSTYIESTPLRRLATSEDVAKVATFLVGPENLFITGQSICVDGGFLNSRSLI